MAVLNAASGQSKRAARQEWCREVYSTRPFAGFGVDMPLDLGEGGRKPSLNEEPCSGVAIQRGDSRKTRLTGGCQ